MSVEQAVRDAKSPGEALLVLARAIDAVIVNVNELAAPGVPDDANPWAIPDDEPAVDDGVARRKEEAQQELLGLREEARTLSGDDLAANQAKQNLVKDRLRDVMTVEDEPDDTSVVVVQGPEGETEVTLPAVDEATQAARREFAVNELRMREYYGDQKGQALVEAYGKGGPLLFWLSDREFVMSLPRALRRQMVEEVATYAPARAKDMGRDILKLKVDEGDGLDIAAEHAARMKERHG